MDPVLIWISVIVLSGLFLSAGLHKACAPAYYRGLISGYTGLSSGLAGLAGNLLALTEISIGASLLWPPARIAAAGSALGLLLLYSLLITVSLLRGLDMDCGCSGPLGRQKLSPWLLLRNGMLLLCTWLPTNTPANRATGLGDLLIILCSSAALIFVYLAFEQLLANREKLVLLRNR